MGGLLRSALFAMKRLTSADTTRAPATIAPPAASRCSAFVGSAKELLEIQWLNLCGGINSKILCVECPLEPDVSEPMLHCNGNKLTGPSFPNRSLPIASSMIATNNRKPKEMRLFAISGVGFFQRSCLSLSVSRHVDYLLRRIGSKILSPSARYSSCL